MDKAAGRPRPIVTDAEKTEIQKSYAAARDTHDALEETGYLDVKGFGTIDPLKIIKFLDKAGISLKDFSSTTPENRAKRADHCSISVPWTLWRT